LHQATQEEAAQFVFQPQFTDNFQNIRWGGLTNALQSCNKELSLIWLPVAFKVKFSTLGILLKGVLLLHLVLTFTHTFTFISLQFHLQSKLLTQQRNLQQQFQI